MCRNCNDNEADSKCRKGLWCRPCKQAYDRQYWQSTSADKRSRRRNNVKLIRMRNRKYLWNYLLEHGCIDCGNNDPRVLHFDHLRDKLYNISEMVANYSIETIELEIAKCEVRCANCHSIKTSIQFGWYENI